VHSVVRQAGGFIAIESSPGRTTFSIGLPAVTQPEAAVEAPATPALGHGETVLVVEDEEPVRRLACITLTRGGYRVLEAEGMAAAIEVFDRVQGAIDLLVTDVVMPQGGGRALAEALEARKPGLPVLYSSGYADDATLRHGISRQDVPFLAKPYAPAALLDQVSRLLEAARARRNA
jgi:two-component system cell cycle sensor histidine kinase/response regulator CckA